MKIIHLNSGILISERTFERSYIEDIAIHPFEDKIVVVGFDNKKRKNVPVQVAFAVAMDSKKLTEQVFSSWGFSGDSMGNDMADTRLYRVSYGYNDKLYILGETAGGNTAFRWNGKDFQTSTLITYDSYNTGYQTRSEHKMYYAELNDKNGQVVRGQMTFPRTSSNQGNTNRAKDASFFIDKEGIIYIGSGGTAFARESSSPGGGSIQGIGLSGNKVIILGTSNGGYLIDESSKSRSGLQSEPPHPFRKDNQSNLYLGIFEKP